MLSESRFNRRWHKIKAEQWQEVLTLLAQCYPQDTFLIDSYPVPRLPQSPRLPLSAVSGRWPRLLGLLRGERRILLWPQSPCDCHRKRTSRRGSPAVRMQRRPDGHEGVDLRLARRPASLYADKAYTDYTYEESLLKEKKIAFLPIRKSNHKRQYAKEVAKRVSRTRKRIETTFSQITAKLPRRLQAVTPEGFESKVMATFVAFAILLCRSQRIAEANKLSRRTTGNKLS